ncbi:hypothetical protein [Winogradskyella sp. 3972H.M.0a.05]|uniref:SecDF P1 head subdomain-containing protein n=1 Tax=Winogradskyella sp. 3972H.M.0a.05 TaxID=2950277 RepID=UPI0033945DA2
MKRIALLSLLLLFSCGNFSQNKEGVKIVCAFADETSISIEEKNSTVETIKERLSRFSDDYEVKLSENNQIVVEYYGEYNESNLIQIITNEGKLDFWFCLKKDDVIPILAQTQASFNENGDDDPLMQIESLKVSYVGIFDLAVKDTLKMNTFLNKVKIEESTAKELEGIKFLYGIPDESGNITLYALETSGRQRALVNESHIVNAMQNYNYIGKPCVAIEMNEEGAQRWELMTGRAYQEQRNIAITLNNVVFSAPGVSVGPIEGGRSEISGNFTLEEAQSISTVLKSKRSIPVLKLLEVKLIKRE